MEEYCEFQPGDRVIILSGKDYPDYSCGWANDMERYVGKEYELRCKRTGYPHGWRVEGIGFLTFDDRCMVKVEDCEIDLEDFDDRFNEFLGM